MCVCTYKIPFFKVFHPFPPVCLFIHLCLWEFHREPNVPSQTLGRNLIYLFWETMRDKNHIINQRINRAFLNISNHYQQNYASTPRFCSLHLISTASRFQRNCPWYNDATRQRPLPKEFSIAVVKYFKIKRGTSGQEDKEFRWVWIVNRCAKGKSRSC